MKALIVEDEYTSSVILQKMLADHFEVDVARDGKEAVSMLANAMCSKESYRLVCLDIMMPVMDGHAVLREIRDIEKRLKSSGNPEVKIIITSSKNDMKSVNQAYSEMCDDYIVKPIDKDELLEKLKDLKLI